MRYWLLASADNSSKSVAASEQSPGGQLTLMTSTRIQVSTSQNTFDVTLLKIGVHQNIDNIFAYTFYSYDLVTEMFSHYSDRILQLYYFTL